MLVLSRRIGSEIVIAGNVRVRVVGIDRGKVRLGVTAPKDVAVDRSEVHEQKMRTANFQLPTPKVKEPAA